MPRLPRRALGPVLVVAALAATSPAEDCTDLDATAAAVRAAADAIGAARSGVVARADLVPLLAGAHGAIDAADVLASTAANPAELVAMRTTLRDSLATGLRAVGRAELHPTRRRKARKMLVRAARAVAKAAELLDRVTAPAACGVTLNGALGGEQIFPADNWWNVDVSARPVAANSDAVIDFIGRNTRFHADFGTDFGIPYVVVDSAQPLTPLTFLYDDESDHAAPGSAPGYPIPPAAKTTPGFIEGGVAGGGSSGDRHLLLVDRGRNLLFETYATRWNGTAWSAGSGAIFDLSSNARRPEGWTSADAAGLAIFPGLVRADEAIDAGEIRHALRFTVRATQGYVYPASHDATHGAGGASRPPLGLRVRMKASVDLSAMSAPARAVFTAMKKYGLILADNGSDWYVTGALDPRWDDERMHDDFARVTGDDFEVVE